MAQGANRCGDYVTSPSLGSDFAVLLAHQLSLWLQEIPADGQLSLVEVGPGEGDMAADLIASLATLIPDQLGRMDLVLVERNQGMRERQRQRLAGVRDLPIRWCSLEELQAAPVRGVVLAHELLDALPVDRLTWQEGSLQLQGVALSTRGTLESVLLPLQPALLQQIAEISSRAGVDLPPSGSPEGWTSEWHSDQFSWLQSMRAGLRRDFAGDRLRHGGQALLQQSSDRRHPARLPSSAGPWRSPVDGWATGPDGPSVP